MLSEQTRKLKRFLLDKLECSSNPDFPGTGRTHLRDSRTEFSWFWQHCPRLEGGNERKFPQSSVFVSMIFFGEGIFFEGGDFLWKFLGI